MKILMVEDEAELALSVKKGLEKRGFVVELEYNGEEGEYRALNYEFDALILDLNLPDKDGIEVCKNLRDNGIETPMIMLTARNSIENRIEGLDSGSDDYLTKPFELDELRARIHALIRRSYGRTKLAIEIGSIYLNPSTREVRYGDSDVELTAKEFDILEFLLERHPGYATAEDIIDHVWHEEFNPFSNVVKVHIANLRRKLRKASGENLIEAVKGIGYRVWEKQN